MQTSVLQQSPIAGLGAPSTRPESDHQAATLADLVDAYMAAYAGRDRTRPRILAWWVAKLGERPFGGITDDDIFAALEQLRIEPARRYAGRDRQGRAVHRFRPTPKSAGTVNRYHAALMAVFTWAIRTRRAPRTWENPARRIERLPESGGVVRFLTDEERERLLAACRAARWPRLYLLVLLAITTGARRSELLSLTWGRVDLARGVAHLEATKNGHPRTLPLVPAVVEELARFRSNQPEACVFPSRSRRDEPRHFETAWRAALERAAIKRFRFHDLRHTCASYLAQHGASLLEIADVMGHRQLEMVKRYAHLTVDTKAKLVNRVLGEIK